MEIIIENENANLVEYSINFEQAKAYLQEELKKYEKLVVTDEFIQSAKKSRAELNAKKKELVDRFRTVKKKHNEPIDKLKLKVDELIELIEAPLNNIDERIKEYEAKIRDMKLLTITEIFVSIKSQYNIDVKIDTIFNQKWLNTDYSKKKITEEITLFFQRAEKDLLVIESFDDEFVIPLKEVYLECFDMSIVMQKKIAYDKQKKEKEIEKPKDMSELPVSEENEVPKQILPEEQEKPQERHCAIANNIETELEYIEFWVKVTPEQKLCLRKCVLDNNISCGKIVR